MIDLNGIRADPAGVAGALAKRGAQVEFAELLEWDQRRRSLIVEGDALRARRNEVSGRIPQRKRRGEPVQELIEEMRGVGQRIKQLDADRTALDRRIQEFLEQLPNVPDADVAGGGKESNSVLRAWGGQTQFDFAPQDHITIATNLGLIDFERGVKVAGNGFWVYRGAGALLEMALINYCIGRNVAAGYELMLLPHIVNWECGYVSGQFPKFGQDVYRLAGDGDGQPAADGRDGHVLIPTAETALAALHQDEILDAATLPRKYCAFTPCYRREAGSYRTHDRGTIRGHQFHKVELFQFVAPEQSDAALHRMLEHAESLVRDLGLHYRVSQLAAGDCSAAAAKTYDVEVWIPSMQSYEEVSSASNTRDYQARRGGTRLRGPSGTSLVHTLNASGLATSRLLPALLETYQRADGTVAVPEVLQPYTGLTTIAARHRVDLA
jgi:seryl-tRNA synthetase